MAQRVPVSSAAPHVAPPVQTWLRWPTEPLVSLGGAPTVPSLRGSGTSSASRRAAAGCRLLDSALPGLFAGTVASAATLAATLRRARLVSARRQLVASCRAVAPTGAVDILADIEPRFPQAVEKAKTFDFSKVDTYPIQQLEELYIDSKWIYYNENKKILEDYQFDLVKKTLKQMGSRFPTLKRVEVAFIEATIAFYQGKPIVSDEDFEKLKKMVSNSGRRKDVTSFILYERGAKYLSKQDFGLMEKAFVGATLFDFKKLARYSMAELEELYIDALWCYYREKKPLLSDKNYDLLKQELYKRDSKFSTLKRDEVAFVEAAIAYYRGDPIISSEEYRKLRAQIEAKGVRKDVTAFLLYERGEQFLDTEQFEAMKEEYEKLGLTPVDFEQCNLAQLEEMYVDALWAYYKDGVQLLSDEQYDKLRMELQCQDSGFPTLSRAEVSFVEASLSFWRGEPVMSDEEWKETKKQVLANGKRKDVTAFLLYSKGQETLDPETFEEMKEEMARMGVTVRKVGTKALQQTLSITSDKLENDLGQVALMVTALGLLPTTLCTIIVWSLGLFYDLEFVPNPNWQALLTAEFIPLFLAGLTGGLLLTWRLFVFLDLQNPTILVGCCPSCEAEIKLFSGGDKPEAEVKYSCKSCGCTMALDTINRRIASAGLGASIRGQEPEVFDWNNTWTKLKDTNKQVVDA